LYTDEAFEILSELWVKVGWNQKYIYTFSWMGRPIIQLPEDIMRIQEVIYKIKPDVIIETGIAHGGSLIFYASLCKAMEKGRVIGIDIEIRPGQLYARFFWGVSLKINKSHNASRPATIFLGNNFIGVK
jgi:cephalosporin hydroxylase